MKKIILLLCFFSFITFFPSVQSPTFIKGITINGIDVEGLTVTEAKEKLKPLVEKVESQEVILVSPAEEKIWLTDYKKMGIKCNLEKALNEGIAKGNKGNLCKRWWEKIKGRTKGYDIPLTLGIDEKVAEQEISNLTQSLVREPVDAKLVVHPDNTIEIKPDSFGLCADTQLMIADLKNKLKLQGPISIGVKLKEVQPKVTQKDIEKLKIEKLLGQFTTWFNPQQKNRSHNIKLAPKHWIIICFHQMRSFLLMISSVPGQKKPGTMKPHNIKQQICPRVGGGVCQVSSTLYNVLLRANLPVTERHAHTLPVHYVPKGMDAAVVYGIKDLKFINNTPGHILIKTYVWQSGLTIKLFGSRDEEVQIELQSIIEETVPPDTIVKKGKLEAEGNIVVEQEGSPGFVVRVERIIRNKENKIIIHEIISRDFYFPVEKIIVISN